MHPGKQDHEADAGADGGVGDVEGGEADLATAAGVQVEVDEIDDVTTAGHEAVEDIAENPAEEQSEGELAERACDLEMPAVDPQRDHGEQGDAGERVVLAPEHAPGGPGIAPMDELEKPVNDDAFLLEAQQLQHGEFGALIQHKDNGCDHRDSLVHGEPQEKIGNEITHRKRDVRGWMAASRESEKCGGNNAT